MEPAPATKNTGPSLRPYQREAVDAVYRHLRERDDNPCVVLPTGSGKSWVLATIASDAVNRWNGRVLVLAHVKELLEQNASKIRALCDGTPVGVYSAGLGSRDTTQPIIVAGIQSVYDKADELGGFDLVIVDECHLIPPDGEGMYRTLLQALQAIRPHVRIIGLTATPFRLKGGLICKPGNLENKVCYEAGLAEMIAGGYLSRLTTKAGRAKADLDKLRIVGGEFVSSEAEAAMNADEVVSTACSEIVERTMDRKAVLIFCSSVAHCKRVAVEIERKSGEECAIVTGDTPAEERAEILARFRGEPPADLFGVKKTPLKFVANVECLTTGTDVPGIDCVALLRPTNSPGLLLQMVGRGMRLAPGKENCLVLDYGGNIARHGPIDCIRVREKPPHAGRSRMPLAKECPSCHEMLHPAIMTCPVCGHSFKTEEEKPAHDAHASSDGILSADVKPVEEEVEVEHVFIQVHTKMGAPPDAPKTVRLKYYTKSLLRNFSEWLCPEHKGYARRKFLAWWAANAQPWASVPSTAEDCAYLCREGALKPVSGITVRTTPGDPFPRIIGHKFDESVTTAEEDSVDEDPLPF